MSDTRSNNKPTADATTSSNDSRVDVLGDVLSTLRFRGTIFFRSQLAAPWGMALERVQTPRFHIALGGDCVIGIAHADHGTDQAADQLVELNSMEIAIVPHGNMHWIADQPGRPLVTSAAAGAACELGNPLFQSGKITNKLICGLVHYETEMHHPILASLPSVLHFSKLAANETIWMTALLINAEMEATQTRQSAVVDRLTEVLFLKLLEQHTRQHQEIKGFFAALGNPRIYRALELIHASPQQPWTLEILGDQAAMSRATLTRQFKNVLGETPLSYIANWRMMRAMHLLKHSALALEDIADKAGFSGARSLNKAFSRKYGYTPSVLRQRLGDCPTTD